jgi:hypothetical protein
VQEPKGLCPHITSEHRAKSGHHYGQEELDMETLGTPTHRQISGMVQVNHNGAPIGQRFSFHGRSHPTVEQCEILKKKTQTTSNEG